jgi:hypothetical protein
VERKELLDLLGTNVSNFRFELSDIFKIVLKEYEKSGEQEKLGI